MADLHPVLARQLRRIGLAAGQAPDAVAFDTLLDHISRAYADVDQERYVLDRSENIASQEMVALNRALRVSEARLTSLLSLSSDWVWEQDDTGRFTYVSEGLTLRAGLDSTALLGHRCDCAGPLQCTAADLLRLQSLMAQGQPFHDLTIELHDDRGLSRYLRISGEPEMQGGHLVGYRGVGSDVTDAVRAQRRIEELARYDSLTGLPNRYRFMEELEHALARGHRSGSAFALLFIDLDRFKFVNDHLGHGAGDTLLRVMGERLGRLMRKADRLGRLGGDEFVILTDTDCSPAALSALAERVIEVAAQPIDIEGCAVRVSASVGISVYPQDGADGSTLLKAADAAMYQAKMRGRNTHEFFTAELSQRAALRFALEGDLRRALEQEELRLYYQPQVDALSGELIGMEALLRWQHPDRGLLSPAVFIDLAEESGLIVPIGRWVLHEACRQMRAWQDAGLRPPRCSVNVSARQLTGTTLIDDAQSALKTAGLSACDLEIEVTESLLMVDPQHASRTLDALHVLGVHIAIDDFGTGYSSLAYLKKFPAQTLKIDRSFVRQLPTDGDDLAITRAVLALGHSLDMRVVAEGVETAAQQDCLRELGCDVLQGYLYGKPMPAGALQARLPRALPLNTAP